MNSFSFVIRCLLSSSIIVVQVTVTKSKSLTRKLDIAATMQLVAMKVLCLRCASTKFGGYCYNIHCVLCILHIHVKSNRFLLRVQKVYW